MSTATPTSIDRLLASLPASIEGYDLRRERERAQRLPIEDVRRRRAERPLLVSHAGGGYDDLASEAVGGPMGGPIHAPTPSGVFSTGIARGPLGSELRGAFYRDVVGGGLRIGRRHRIVDRRTPQAGPYCLWPGDATFDATLEGGRVLLPDDHPTLIAATRRVAERGDGVVRYLSDDTSLGEAVASFAHDVGEVVNAQIGGEPFGVLPVKDAGEAVEVVYRLGAARCLARIREKYGQPTLERLARELGAPAAAVAANADEGTSPVPLCRLLLLPGAAWPGFGAIELLPAGRRAADLAAAVAEAIDPTPLPELLEQPGRLAELLAGGRVPLALAAAVVLPGFDARRELQLPERAAAVKVWDAIAEAGVPLVLDESWSFARTERLLHLAQMHVDPDAVLIGRGAPLCAIAVRGALGETARRVAPRRPGSDTSVLDVERAVALLDAIRHDRDPVLDGLSYAQNVRLKGEYMAAALERIAARHRRAVLAHAGSGALHAVRVADAAAVDAACRARGLLLIEGRVAADGSGWLGIGLPLDVLACEIEDVAAALCAALADVEGDDSSEEDGAAAEAGDR